MGLVRDWETTPILTFPHQGGRDLAPDAHPTLLRWTDFLTGRTCTLRVEDSDAGAPLGSLVSKYLTGADPDALPDALVKRRRMLPGAAAALAAIQDLTHALTDEGALDGLAPGSVFKLGVRELSAREAVPVSRARVQGAEVGLLDVTIDRSETDYSRNWIGFHRRRWLRSESKFLGFVARAIRAGGDDANRVLSLNDHASRMEFLRRMARGDMGQPIRELLTIHRGGSALQDGRRVAGEHHRRTRRHMLGEGAGAEVRYRCVRFRVAVPVRGTGRDGSASGEASEAYIGHVRLSRRGASDALLAAHGAGVHGGRRARLS